MHKVFWVSLSAALIAARLSGAAETTYGAELDRIEELVESGNWVELRGFLRARPELMDGDDPFARELQNFVGQTSSLYSALIIDQVSFPDVKNARTALASDSIPTQTTPLQSQEPYLGENDLLLDAELSALKGLPELEPKQLIAHGEGDQVPRLVKTSEQLAKPANEEQSIEMAALSLEGEPDPSDISPVTRSLGGFSASAVAGVSDIGRSEPDAAVATASDAASIY